MAPLAKSCRRALRANQHGGDTAPLTQLRQVAFAPGCATLSPEGRGDAVEGLVGLARDSRLGSPPPARPRTFAIPHGLAAGGVYRGRRPLSGRLQKVAD